MKYLCLVYLADDKLHAVPDRECLNCGDELRKKGLLLAAEPLFPAQTAKTVRVREGRVSITDGPFAETKEQLAGFYLIDAASHDEALRSPRRFRRRAPAASKSGPSENFSRSGDAVSSPPGCSWPRRPTNASPPAPTEEQPPEIEVAITVSATRTGGRLEDQPLRVEVLEREEIEEKMLMTPGDIVMMLNEMGGMRVQATSPSLGAASVRVQGMRGRYTRFLSDGLPLFGEVGGLGLLQIPPMDLAQVEVIKGVASSLYGAGAMGGVVNLISRQPGRGATARVSAQPLDARRHRRGGLFRRHAAVDWLGR